MNTTPALSVGHGATSVTEAVWRKAETAMARRERLRLIRLGRIVPAHRMQPQMLVREGGKWVPQLVIRSS